MDINEKVLLLAILKKESDETLNDVVLKLENTNLFSLKEGKRLLKKLKSEEFISDSFLTLKGEVIAKNVEQEFKL
jgi:tRNA U54 and U55 pseudouridine synthase Pus10